MWSQIIYFCSFVAWALAEPTAPGINREVGDGVKSLGYKMLYGDEDLNVINEVVSNMEKNDSLKAKVNINDDLPPLPPDDVKCLMSVDRYCSKEMGEMKSVLVKALKDECKECTNEQKEKAGKVAASMMAHDPVAWKTFLTRTALQSLPPKNVPKREILDFKPVGEPEEVMSSKSRHTKPGFKVRVKRYAAEILHL